MRLLKPFHILLILSFIVCLISCDKKSKSQEYIAYFGGEVTNPTSPYILFCRNNEVIDSIKIKKDNTFFIKFDSLAPGLYTFKSEPEYQSVYFDKNDSIMVRINDKEFDESIVFCGRGDEKNNFLMELFLRNERDKSKMFDVFDLPIPKFIPNIDSSFNANKKFYQLKRNQIKWSPEFDEVAQAAVNFHHYSKKELYPFIHKMRTGVDIWKVLPQHFYDYRREINFNNDHLSDFAPYVNYLSYMLNNVGTINYHNHFTDVDLALRTNINKLKIADTLIKNEKVKNLILNNIAFAYLMEDQNMLNNQKFLDTYHKYSTDKSKKNEINIIGNAIQLLKPGNTIPTLNLIDPNGKKITSSDLFQNKTVVYFWTSKANSHLIAVHKKIDEQRIKYPDYTFIGINIIDNQSKWYECLTVNNLDKKFEYRCENFDDLKTKWAITKVHRTIVLNKQGVIKNAFTNLFNIDFDSNLN